MKNTKQNAPAHRHLQLSIRTAMFGTCHLGSANKYHLRQAAIFLFARFHNKCTCPAAVRAVPCNPTLPAPMAPYLSMPQAMTENIRDRLCTNLLAI